MACFKPISAWQLDSGEVVFSERGKIRRALTLPCGRCIGCRIVKTRAWAVRCMHESRMHESSSFITLTFDDEHFKPSLDYRDFQLFLKRLRKSVSKVRFFMCGEYGDLLSRPHYHALLFGVSFPNLKQIGTQLYRSAELERLWPYGYSSIGSVTFDSARYVASYTFKKATGPLADRRYSRVDADTGECFRVVPEFAHMSLKPGIGYGWFQKYWRDVYLARDGVVDKGGRVIPTPRYYDTLLRRSDEIRMEDKEYERYLNSLRFVEDCSPSRLAVREACAVARQSNFKRKLV